MRRGTTCVHNRDSLVVLRGHADAVELEEEAQVHALELPVEDRDERVEGGRGGVNDKDADPADRVREPPELDGLHPVLFRALDAGPTHNRLKETSFDLHKSSGWL